MGERDGAPILGLRALNDSDTLIDMAACPMMSPALEAWLKDFRQNLPALARGGARLRVSPTGDRGVWLDLPNEQIHTLMVDGRSLSKITQGVTSEIMGEGWTPAPARGRNTDPMVTGFSYPYPLDEWRERARSVLAQEAA